MFLANQEFGVWGSNARYYPFQKEVVMNRADIVIGLGFGDEGKGSWVDHLVRQHGARTVIRFNGGAQAGHQVVTADGRSHIFAQFGSGMFVSGTDTLLSRFMLVEPEAILKEASVLQSKGIENPMSRLIISENAPVVGPYNRLLNRIAECYRGDSRHGSCGFGIGVTQQDVETLGDQALYMRDLKYDGGLRKMQYLLKLKCQQSAEYADARTEALIHRMQSIDLPHYADLFLRVYHQAQVISEEECGDIIRDGSSVFEGAQGVLLDQCYGFFPHCTRSHCTFRNALTLLNEAGFDGLVAKTGLLRAYGTRHGAGPFPTEDGRLEVPPCHNHFNDWQGDFRVGWFDGVLARFSLEVAGSVDVLGITNLDRLSGKGELKIATAYEGTRATSPDGRNLAVIEGDLDLLKERTAAMQTLTPRYQIVPGFHHTEGEAPEEYLHALAEIVGHSIDAYSTSPHQKRYQPFF